MKTVRKVCAGVVRQTDGTWDRLVPAPARWLRSASGCVHSSETCSGPRWAGEIRWQPSGSDARSAAVVQGGPCLGVILLGAAGVGSILG